MKYIPFVQRHMNINTEFNPYDKCEVRLFNIHLFHRFIILYFLKDTGIMGKFHKCQYIMFVQCKMNINTESDLSGKREEGKALIIHIYTVLLLTMMEEAAAAKFLGWNTRGLFDVLLSKPNVMLHLFLC